MAWHSKSPLTEEQKSERHNRKGGLLSTEEQNEFVELVRSGVLIEDATRALGWSDSTVQNTRYKHPEFHQAVNDALSYGCTDRVEKAIQKNAEQGFLSTEEVWVPVYDKKTREPLCNDDGTWKMRLLKKKSRVIPVPQAQKLWAQAYKPEKYVPQVEATIEQRIVSDDPETARAEMLKNIAGLKNNL